MKIQCFKLWYDDGTVWDGCVDGSWTEAPTDGLIQMMIYYDGRDAQNRALRLALSGDDIYLYDGKELIGSNRDTLEENQTRYPKADFIRGMWTTNEKYLQMHRGAFADYHESPPLPTPPGR